MASSAPTSPLRQLFDDRISQLSTEVEALFVQARERERRDFSEQLNGSVRRLRVSGDTESLVATLVDAVGAFASGVAFFRIEGKMARGERIRGVPDESADRFPGMTIPLDSAAALAGAVESRDPVIAIATANEISPELLAVTGESADARVSVFPVLVRDEVRALVYAWGGVQVASTELLCQVAAAVWAGMERLPALVQIEAPPKRSRPAWESLPAAEQQLHLKAQRFARVHVAELRLHESQAVQTGRARRDLYAALRESIDAARATFRDKFFATCPSMVDYLHLELVRALANDEAGLLGKDYPGPLV
jgi:hypothetical protein